MKVRLADLIDCNASAWESHGKKISGMHADFVLVGPKDTRIVACIELDDRSHNAASTYERDKIKINALKNAAIPLIRFPAKRIYDKKAIKTAIKVALREARKR